MSQQQPKLPPLLSLWTEDIEQKLLPFLFPLDSTASTSSLASVPAYTVLPLLACHFVQPTVVSLQTNNVHSLLVARRPKFDIWQQCDREIRQRAGGDGRERQGEEKEEEEQIPERKPLDGWGMMKPLLQTIFRYNYEQSQLLPLYKYRSVEESDVAVYLTLQYMFFHVKNGIYVKIKDGQLAAFVPFHNQEPKFQNNWAQVPSSRPLRIQEIDIHSLSHASAREMQTMIQSVSRYYQQKQEMWGKLYPDEGYLPDPRTWWANAGILDNVQSSEGWSTARNAELRDMIVQTCQSMLVPDCQFFLNKRDFPHFHYHLESQQLKEPYPFLFENVTTNDPPSLVTHASVSYTSTSRFAPIFSLATSSVGRFADLLFPLPDDWNLATGQDPDLLKLRASFPSWSEKKNQLVWRGSATGPGVTPETNQRLAVVLLAQDHPKQMDCALTGLNLRDRVNVVTGDMEYLSLETARQVCKKTKEKTVNDFAALKKNHFLSFVDQCSYKYLLYVQGHSAAFRYGKMMFSHSLILKVESTVLADKLWFFDALKGYSPLGNPDSNQEWERCDHIVVQSDLSDLVDILEWCELHDEMCAKMARNAYTLALQLFTKDTIMQYIHNSLIQVHLNATHFITEFLPVVPPRAPVKTEMTSSSRPMEVENDRI
jgi:hypothetical protein